MKVYAIKEIPEFTWNTLEGLKQAVKERHCNIENLTIETKVIPDEFIRNTSHDNPRFISDNVRESLDKRS
jgi:hypothetical protein